MKDLDGRVAVVTGGASGIGRGMAEAFLAAGMKVVIADVEKDALGAATAELGTKGEVAGFVCDVSDQEQVDQLARQAVDAFGAVHVVCNNAGVAGSGVPGGIWEADLGEWAWVMGVNLMGVVHGIRSFVPILLEQGQGGHVVNTASMAGLIPGGGIYGVTKHAVVALSESLWAGLMGRDPSVRASVLCPGWVNTRIIESERNRPEAPRPDPGPAAPESEAMRKVIEGLIQKGLDPRQVGDTVVEAVREQRFYVLTHPWQNMIEQRMQNILEGRDPVGVMPPGMSADLLGGAGEGTDPS